MTTINDLLDTIEHIARGLAEDDGLYAAEDELAEVRRRVAVLEAENARLKVRAEAREAQLRHAQDRLHRLRQPEADVRRIFDRLKGSGAAVDTRWWSHPGEAEALITVAEGRAAEVDAAMLAIGLYPAGVPIPGPDGASHSYSTDGTPPWEAPDEAVVPRGGAGC